MYIVVRDKFFKAKCDREQGYRPIHPHLTLDAAIKELTRLVKKENRIFYIYAPIKKGYPKESSIEIENINARDWEPKLKCFNV